MKIIALQAIKISPSRQRRLFDPGKMQEFSDKIKSEGLLHPIVLRVEGEHFVLVAGERRLRAISDLSLLGESIRHDGIDVAPGFIPYTLFADLDPLAAEEAELSENINRENLSWSERAAATTRIHSLRARQAEARGDPAHPVAATSIEVRGSSLGSNQETTRRELLVAAHLDDPEVKAAGSLDDAWKVLKKKESSARDKALGESVGRTFGAGLHKCFNEDSLIWLAKCEAETYDVILTDPPYGMGADEFGDSGGLAAGTHGYEDTAENAGQCYSALAHHGFRVCKPQAHLYAFCDIDMFPMLKELFSSAGWWVFRTPLIWHKPSAMRAPWPEHGPQRKYETILYAVKGKKPVTKIAPDLFAYPPDTNRGHAAQKPVALFEDLLRRSIRPGDSVLDPFCGSGPIFPAAHGLKCKATGIELDMASYGISVKRIEALKAQEELKL